MVELQNFHLASYRGIEFNGILTLMEVQNSYINQIYKIIYTLCSDLNMANNMEFQEFNLHFNKFMQNHASSAGFCRAMEAVQLYNCVLLEKLFDNEVLAAAEQLELAVGHLELMVREPRTRVNPQMILLNHGISLLEEAQLKIIESLESVMENSRRTQLQN
jgi:hypothetical protein